MNRRTFIPTLALLPVVAKQFIDNAGVVQPNWYYCLNGVRYKVVQYNGSTGTITIDKCWQIKPNEESTLMFEVI